MHFQGPFRCAGIPDQAGSGPHIRAKALPSRIIASPILICQYAFEDSRGYQTIKTLPATITKQKKSGDFGLPSNGADA